MTTTIDSSGRILIPEPLRERLGLRPGDTVEIRERNGRIEIEPVPTPMDLRSTPAGPVAVPRRPLPTLTDEIVRSTLERTRR